MAGAEREGVFQDFERPRQQGKLQRKRTGRGFAACRSTWAAEWFVVSSEYLVSFASRNSAQVLTCVSLAAVTQLEPDPTQSTIRVCYAQELGRAPCDVGHELLLKVAEASDIAVWVEAIAHAQEWLRRDHAFVPLSCAKEQLAEAERRQAEAEKTAADVARDSAEALRAAEARGEAAEARAAEAEARAEGAEARAHEAFERLARSEAYLGLAARVAAALRRPCAASLGAALEELGREEAPSEAGSEITPLSSSAPPDSPAADRFGLAAAPGGGWAASAGDAAVAGVLGSDGVRLAEAAAPVAAASGGAAGKSVAEADADSASSSGDDDDLLAILGGEKKPQAAKPASDDSSSDDDDDVLDSLGMPGPSQGAALAAGAASSESGGDSDAEPAAPAATQGEGAAPAAGVASSESGGDSDAEPAAPAATQGEGAALATGAASSESGSDSDAEPAAPAATQVEGAALAAGAASSESGSDSDGEPAAPAATQGEGAALAAGAASSESGSDSDGEAAAPAATQGEGAGASRADGSSSDGGSDGAATGHEEAAWPADDAATAARVPDSSSGESAAAGRGDGAPKKAQAAVLLALACRRARTSSSGKRRRAGRGGHRADPPPPLRGLAAQAELRPLRSALDGLLALGPPPLPRGGRHAGAEAGRREVGARGLAAACRHLAASRLQAAVERWRAWSPSEDRATDTADLRAPIVDGCTNTASAPETSDASTDVDGLAASSADGDAADDAAAEEDRCWPASGGPAAGGACPEALLADRAADRRRDLGLDDSDEDGRDVAAAGSSPPAGCQACEVTFASSWGAESFELRSAGARGAPGGHHDEAPTGVNAPELTVGDATPATPPPQVMVQATGGRFGSADSDGEPQCSDIAPASPSGSSSWATPPPSTPARSLRSSTPLPTPRRTEAACPAAAGPAAASVEGAIHEAAEAVAEVRSGIVQLEARVAEMVSRASSRASSRAPSRGRSASDGREEPLSGRGGAEGAQAGREEGATERGPAHGFETRWWQALAEVVVDNGAGSSADGSPTEGSRSPAPDSQEALSCTGSPTTSGEPAAADGAAAQVMHGCTGSSYAFADGDESASSTELVFACADGEARRGEPAPPACSPRSLGVGLRAAAAELSGAPRGPSSPPQAPAPLSPAASGGGTGGAGTPQALGAGAASFAAGLRGPGGGAGGAWGLGAAPPRPTALPAAPKRPTSYPAAPGPRRSPRAPASPMGSERSSCTRLPSFPRSLPTRLLPPPAQLGPLPPPPCGRVLRGSSSAPGLNASQ